MQYNNLGYCPKVKRLLQQCCSCIGRFPFFFLEILLYCYSSSHWLCHGILGTQRRFTPLLRIRRPRSWWRLQNLQCRSAWVRASWDSVWPGDPWFLGLFCFWKRDWCFAKLSRPAFWLDHESSSPFDLGMWTWHWLDLVFLNSTA